MNTHPGLTDRPIYLDYNATTPTDPRVVDATLPYVTTHFGKPRPQRRGTVIIEANYRWHRRATSGHDLPQPIPTRADWACRRFVSSRVLPERTARPTPAC